MALKTVTLTGFATPPAGKQRFGKVTYTNGVSDILIEADPEVSESVYNGTGHLKMLDAAGFAYTLA